MPKKTEKLKLNTWYENELVLMDDFNYNFNYLDSFDYPSKQSNISTSIGDINAISPTYTMVRYKNTFADISAKHSGTGMNCNSPISILSNKFYESISQYLILPRQITNVNDIYFIKISAIGDTSKQIYNNILYKKIEQNGSNHVLTFTFLNNINEIGTITKNIFINIKAKITTNEVEQNG